MKHSGGTPSSHLGQETKNILSNRDNDGLGSGLENWASHLQLSEAMRRSARAAKPLSPQLHPEVVHLTMCPALTQRWSDGPVRAQGTRWKKSSIPDWVNGDSLGGTSFLPSSFHRRASRAVGSLKTVPMYFLPVRLRWEEKQFYSPDIFFFFFLEQSQCYLHCSSAN